MKNQAILYIGTNGIMYCTTSQHLTLSTWSICRMV